MKPDAKSRSGAGRRAVSVRQAAAIVLVLLAAAGVGMVIREYRFRSAREELPAKAPGAAQPISIPKTREAPAEPNTRDTREPASVNEVTVEPEWPAPQPASAPPPPQADEQSNVPVQMEPAAAPPQTDSRSEEAAARERRGREALAMIGHDPAADEVWIQAINDPSLSASARQNLIEDLNEDGLSYRNLTMDDLPVIEYRIGLIEDLRPYAMDKVNADAFDEAHKDLVNMANRLTGR
jgi:type IV secretory pathway VirB10-like protein